MINFTLYKQGLKANYKIFLIFLAILTMYITMIIGLYNPDQANALAEFSKTMPEVMEMVGMTGDTTSLMGFIITYLYGFLFMLIPMVVTIMLANKLIASHTDRGSMAYLLSSSNSRSKIIFTQMKVLWTFILLLLCYTTTLCIIVSSFMAPGELDIGKFLIVNVGLLLLHLAISGICFLASSICNETKNSLIIGAGIPVVFFLIQMLSNMGDTAENLKYLTIFTLFDPQGIVKGDTTSYILAGSLGVIAITLYFISFNIFKRRDLSV